MDNRTWNPGDPLLRREDLEDEPPFWGVGSGKLTYRSGGDWTTDDPATSPPRDRDLLIGVITAIAIGLIALALAALVVTGLTDWSWLSS